MKKVSLPQTGGCHCGALRYELSAAPLFVAVCHCTNCQKIGGSAFAINAMIRGDGFTFTRGTPKSAEWVSDAGNQRFGWFCGDCGGRIAHGLASAPEGILSLRCGTLDDRSWVAPVGHYWTRSKQSWIGFGPDELVYETQPADFTELVDRFSTLCSFS